MHQNHTRSKVGPQVSPRNTKGSRSKVVPAEPLVTEDRPKKAMKQGVGMGPQKPSPARGTGIGSDESRFDRPGHISEGHASRLLHLSRKNAKRDEFEMIFDSAATDDLATELGEFAVTSMVGGGETWLDKVNAPSEEEDGGPFLETGGEQEFATGSDDESDGYLREAFPTSSASRPESSLSMRRRRRG